MFIAFWIVLCRLLVLIAWSHHTGFTSLCQSIEQVVLVLLLIMHCSASYPVKRVVVNLNCDSVTLR